MTTPNDQAEQYIGKTKGLPNYTHDLIHDLSNRLDALWRYDQCIANADKAGAADGKQLWEDFKAQEMKNVDRLKELIKKQMTDGSF